MHQRHRVFDEVVTKNSSCKVPARGEMSRFRQNPVKVLKYRVNFSALQLGTGNGGKPVGGSRRGGRQIRPKVAIDAGSGN
jgi:hypothetical protein